MLRGTRIIRGDEAKRFREAEAKIGAILTDLGFEQIIVPAIWESLTFFNKLGAEKESQMWTFQDKGDRACCLIPEVTGIIQEMWNSNWSKFEDTLCLFYIARCYRYERPQAGRYREFTQVGVEILGNLPKDKELVLHALRSCLECLKINYEFKEAVKRGLSYYVEDGFEVERPSLGAQKQVAGGGRYKEGIGWAIGLDRLLLNT